jgi:hypothetical protein
MHQTRMMRPMHVTSWYHRWWPTLLTMLLGLVFAFFVFVWLAVVWSILAGGIFAVVIAAFTGIGAMIVWDRRNPW